MSEAENPRAVAGGNNAPDFAQLEMERLQADYGNLNGTVEELLEEARNAPATIDDDETSGVVADLVVRIRGTARRIEGFREAEKEPYLRRGNAVQAFFDTLHLKLSRKAKTDKAGAADILHARVNDWNQRKAAAERARLAEIERLAREEADRARRAQEEADRKAEAERLKQAEANASAERARKAENIEAHTEKADGHGDAAVQHEAVADAAAAAAAYAEQAASDAAIEQKRKSADLVRQRTSGGTLNTMRQVGHVEIVDKDALDIKKLWPFLKDEHVLMALRAWAKTTSHKTPMEGAIVEMRDETVLR